MKHRKSLPGPEKYTTEQMEAVTKGLTLLRLALDAMIEMYQKIHPEIPDYEVDARCLNAVPLAGEIANYFGWKWPKKKEPTENFGFLRHARVMELGAKKKETNP